MDTGHPQCSAPSMIHLKIMPLSKQQTAAVIASISPARMGTYMAAGGFGATANPLDIYVWNALISGAFIPSLHICEVVVRNAIADALALKYGLDWPWNSNFERTLTNWWKSELVKARQGIAAGSTGKVIAELTFSFWCDMFTARQDQHIWNAHLHTVFPFSPLPLTVAATRKMLYDDMEALRRLRNRIAHHEPIFTYRLAEQQARIHRMIKMRCSDTDQWLAQWELVSAALNSRP